MSFFKNNPQNSNWQTLVLFIQIGKVFVSESAQSEGTELLITQRFQLIVGSRSPHERKMLKSTRLFYTHSADNYRS